MKTKTTLLLTALLFATPLLAIADETTNITELIEKAKNASFSERFELIGQIKAQLSTMNEDDRAAAMAEIQVARDSTREKRKEQFGGEMSEDRIAEIKENMSPEQVKNFEERLESHKNGDSVRRGPPTKEKITEIKANMSPEQIKEFDARINAYQKNAFNKKHLNQF